MEHFEAYIMAQQAITNLKSSVYLLLKEKGINGLRNVQIGKALGIYMGHARHEGHIPRTILEIMQNEGVVIQNPDSKKWFLTDLCDDSDDV